MIALPPEPSSIDRFALLDWLLPFSNAGAVSLEYPKANGPGPGWVYGSETVDWAVGSYHDGSLADQSFACRTQSGNDYTITNASRLGLVLHRDEAVTVFCVDLDDHHGDGGNVASLEAVGRFLNAQPVVFSSRSGTGYHAFFRLESPMPVEDFVRWSTGWGYNRKARPEVFPKTDKLSQVWMPNEPNQEGGDTYVSGSFDGCVVSALPEPPSRSVTSKTIAFLSGESKPGSRNADLNTAAFGLGKKGFARPEAWRLCERGARLCGLEPEETAATFESGFRSGCAAGPDKAAEETTSQPPPLTGIGNGERFARDYKGDARYCHDLDEWLVWDGKRWSDRAPHRVQRMAKDTIRAIDLERRDVLQTVQDEDRKKKIDSAYRVHIKRSATANGVAEVLKMARSEPGLVVSLGGLDRDPMLFNAANGTVDLHTGKLRPHQRSDLITTVPPASYTPGTDCPKWRAFLLRILGGDEEVYRFLQRAIGYALTGRTDEQCLFFLYGSGQNGKSTFINTLLALFADCGQKAPTDLIMRPERSNGGGPTPDVARLRGMRFVTTSELDEGVRLSEARVKDLTGGDRMVGRPLYCKPIEFEPTHTLFCYGNHKPHITGTDDGIWRRIRLIHLPVTIPEHEKDPGLGAALLAELDGILAWAVEGCLDWQRDGLKPPESVQNATSAYRAESDPVGRFIGECCDQSPGLVIPKGELYAAFTKWCIDEGEQELTSKAFGSRMQLHGFTEKRRAQGRDWVGIDLHSGGER